MLYVQIARNKVIITATTATTTAMTWNRKLLGPRDRGLGIGLVLIGPRNRGVGLADTHNADADATVILRLK